MLVARPEDQILICVARQSLDTATAERLRELLGHDLDWKYLLPTAHHHCLLPMLYLHLNAAASSLVPPHVTGRLHRDNQENTRSTLFLTGELFKVLKLLEENDILAVFFKGPTLAVQAYGDVGLRQFGDLDILVHRQDILKVKQLLISRGFNSTLALTNAQQAALLRFDYAYTFENKQGVVLDVHWNLVERRYAFDIDINRLWDRLEPMTISGKKLLTLSAEDLLLILCLHGFTHSWERLGWICDVASLIDRRKDIDWESVLENAAKLGCRHILTLGLFLATEVLEAPVPENVWKALPRDLTVRNLAAQIQRQLFAPRNGSSGFIEGTLLHLRMRERKRDRLRSCIRLTTTPRNYDWMLLPVPDSLFFLHYFLRPLRIAGKQAAKLFITQ